MITKLYSDRQRRHGQIARWLGPMVLSLAGMTLSACGGGSGTGDVNDSGEVVVALTDAEGDFASYTVDVLSLTLTKANGAVVETLPLSTQVDFARYTDLTEFLTAATVPSGVYVKGTMVLDYRAADIWVEDAAGDADPFNYEVNTGALDVAAIAGAAPLAVRGHVTPFGQAPLDFDAQTIVDRSAISP